MNDRYAPPYHITYGILHSIERIGEALGKLRTHSDNATVPILRRGNRIKTIQASLAIEGNTLSLEQVTAVIAGKRVLAPQREIQEVRNAFAAYEELPNWSPYSRKDLLAAHGLMMAGLVDEIGCFRSGKVGIQGGGKMIHLAPPAERVPGLVDDLLAWLEKTDEHPLVSSCVFHYELEFIHPFQDGEWPNGTSRADAYLKPLETGLCHASGGDDHPRPPTGLLCRPRPGRPRCRCHRLHRVHAQRHSGGPLKSQPS